MGAGGQADRLSLPQFRRKPLAVRPAEFHAGGQPALAHLVDHRMAGPERGQAAAEVLDPPPPPRPIHDVDEVTPPAIDVSELAEQGAREKKSS